MKIEKVFINEEKKRYCKKCNKLKENYCIVKYTKNKKVVCFNCLHFGIPQSFKPIGLSYYSKENETIFKYGFIKRFNKIDKDFIIIKGKLSFKPTIFNLYLLALKNEIEKNDI